MALIPIQGEELHPYKFYVGKGGALVKALDIESTWGCRYAEYVALDVAEYRYNGGVVAEMVEWPIWVSLWDRDGAHLGDWKVEVEMVPKLRAEKVA
jgi:hypothetical protein